MREFVELQGASGASYRVRLWPAGEGHLPIAPAGRLALGGPMLAQGRAGPPFRDLQFRSDLIHAGPATGGA